MSSPVKLYVYDLSNGMARQLSRQLTGRQIDGIWHTSVVVYGKEIFYGQGINITQPGRSHHGSPLQVLDMGETSIDEETFNEYLAEMREHYTADKYHLLEFNCNSFTNDCIGFLTGESIPAYIKDLPTDFLSTPFGAALRPTIDAMYRRPIPGATPPAPLSAANASPDRQLAASILQSVAAHAQSNGFPIQPSNPLQATQTLAAPVHVITNPASFHSFVKTHRAAAAFFTSTTCGPCKMIEPIFERLSEEKGVHGGRNGAGFAKIDIDVGMGSVLAREFGVRVTPTFMFFLDGNKINEMKGVDANELRTQVDLLLFQAYPPHPHTSLSLPVLQKISLDPILFTQVPAIDVVLRKLGTFIDATPWPDTATQSQSQLKEVLMGTVSPYLKGRFANPNAPLPLPSASPDTLTVWGEATVVLAHALPVESLFPLVDMWRLALLDPAVANWSATSPSCDPFTAFLTKATKSFHLPAKTSRNYILTVLRLLVNGFCNKALSNRILMGDIRGDMTKVLIPSLLHEDPAVRTAASSLAFNVGGYLQKGRIETVRAGKSLHGENEGAEEDWEVEIVSAVIEAIDREKEYEDVVYRLSASLAFLLRLSPFFETQLKPLLEVLQTKQLLKSKLVKGDGWNAEGGVQRQEVKSLLQEVAGKLCP